MTAATGGFQRLVRNLVPAGPELSCLAPTCLVMHFAKFDCARLSKRWSGRNAVDRCGWWRGCSMQKSSRHRKCLWMMCQHPAAARGPRRVAVRLMACSTTDSASEPQARLSVRPPD